MSVLGHPETGNPKDVTQQNSTHRQRICLIGICKDMMSSMHPSREAGLQDEVVGTFLVTRKFSSSIFCWEKLHKSQEGKSKNTKQRPWLLHFGASAKGLSLPFIATRELTEENLWINSACFTDAFMAAFTDAVKNAIMQILQTVTSHVST